MEAGLANWVRLTGGNDNGENDNGGVDDSIGDDHGVVLYFNILTGIIADDL